MIPPDFPVKTFGAANPLSRNTQFTFHVFRCFFLILVSDVLVCWSRKLIWNHVCLRRRLPGSFPSSVFNNSVYNGFRWNAILLNFRVIAFTYLFLLDEFIFQEERNTFGLSEWTEQLYTLSEYDKVCYQTEVSGMLTRVHSVLKKSFKSRVLWATSRRTDY